MKLLFSGIAVAAIATGVSASASVEEAAALVESGRLDEASAILNDSKDPARYLWQGRIAFLKYDFDKAGSLYGQYRKAMGKGSPAPEASVFSRQLNLADQALESVAEIEVIDSVTVPTASFLNAFRLPASAGRLAEADEVPVDGRSEVASSVFFNERGDFAMWAEPDTTGVYRIAESTRLTDGSWSEPRLADEVLNGGGDTDYPFMCADGTTLYFASDGEDSMGGFDIFMATRDASDGEYLKPRNIGMPFNSPYDDFMMVVDEENGVGWWATDRNRLGDRLTIYIYKLTDSRTNIDPDDGDLLDLARLSDISMTQDPETDYAPLRRSLMNVSQGRPRKPVDFHFYMPGRGMLTSFGDLRSAEGRRLMKEYMAAEKELSENSAELHDLRRRYREAVGAGGRQALTSDIRRLENSRTELRNAVKSLRNRVIEAERR